MNKIFRLFLVVILPLVYSCATLYSGSHDTLHITSLPTEAKVEINGKDAGKTPLTLEIKRSVAKKKITLTLEGYKKNSFLLKKKFNLLAILDIPTIVGGLIDVWSGAITPYSTKYYEIELKTDKTLKEKKQKKSYYNPEDNFYIITFKGDTTYTEPFIKEEYGRVFFTPIGGKRKSLPNDDIVSYKYVHPDNFSIFRHQFIKGIKEAHPYWPEKKPNKYVYMNLCVKNADYKLLSVNFATGVNKDGEFRKFAGTEGNGYYIFKENEFVVYLTKKNYAEELRKYFPDCSDYLNELEKEKISFNNIIEFTGDYCKKHNCFYVKPLPA